MRNDTNESPRRRCGRGESAGTGQWTPELSRRITEQICDTYQDEKGINHLDEQSIPQSQKVLDSLNLLKEIIFPGYTGRHAVRRVGIEFAIGDLVNQVFQQLADQAETALAYYCDKDSCDYRDCREKAEKTVVSLLEKLPEIREVLKTDTQAALDGDPAAKSTDEVIIAYPAIEAISAHRIAHELYKAEIPLLPRIMSEHAHRSTGIDVHPGARIGRNFFVDHGTGVVIGETAVLGEGVKLYQGVTLGALSFPKDEQGQLIKGKKRHPNIEDNVTIYAGATILGDITVGRDSIIGGNVWLTESVPAENKINISPPELSIRKRRSSSGQE